MLPRHLILNRSTIDHDHRDNLHPRNPIRSISNGILIIALVVGMTACTDKGPLSPSTNPTDSKNALSLTKASSGACLNGKRTGKFIPALIGAVAPALIRVGLDTVSVALQKASEEKSETNSALVSTQLSAQDFPDCVQVAVGKFYTNEDDFYGASYPSEESSDIIKEIYEKNKLASLGLLLAEDPLLLIESRVVVADDGTAFKLIASVFHYTNNLVSGLGRDRDLVMSFALSDPDSTGAIDQAAFATLRFDDVAVSPLPFVFTDPESSETVLRSPGPETRWIPVNLPEERKPKDMHLNVTETRDANKFLAFLAGVLDSSKTQLAEVIEQEVVPQKRKQAEDAKKAAKKLERQTALDAQIAAINDEVEARQLYDTYRALIDPVKQTPTSEIRTAAKNALTKMMQANHAYSIIGKPRPFSNARLKELRDRIEL